MGKEKEKEKPKEAEGAEQPDPRKVANHPVVPITDNERKLFESYDIRYNEDGKRLNRHPKPKE